jgi:hypothetical protein
MRLGLALLLSTSIASADVGENAKTLPDVRQEHLADAIVAVHKLATKQVDEALLLSIMWGESRFVPTVRTGKVCGIMQVNPRDIGQPRSDCDVWDRDVEAAVAAGIKEIEIMLADKRVRGNLRRALMYRACGNAAFNGTCKKGAWVDAVLKRAHRLRIKPERSGT